MSRVLHETIWMSLLHILSGWHETIAAGDALMATGSA